MTRPLIIFILAAALSAASLAGDTITLRPQAESARTLADIAILEGPLARQLAGTTIEEAVESVPGARIVTLESLRQTLEKQDKINWGRIALSGSKCVLRTPNTTTSPPAPVLETTRRKDPTPTDVSPTSTTSSASPTVRSLVAARVADLLRADPADIKLEFDDRDHATLNTPTQGCTADIQLLGSSDRQSISIKLFRADSLVLQENVRAKLTIRRTIAVASAPLSRGECVTNSFTVEERWLPPSARPAETHGLEGLAARVAIKAGEVIEVADTEQPLVIKKGDLVDIDCLSGSIHLQIVARALDSARRGETVRFQAPDSKRSFTARADGPRRAVTTTSSAEDNLPVSAAPTPTDNALPPADFSRTRQVARRSNRYADLADKKLTADNAPPTPMRWTNPR